MKALCGVGLLLFILFVQPCQAGERFFLGSSVRIDSNPTFTQIFIPTPEGTGYVVGELNSPPRIVLNLYPLEMILPREEITVADKFVQTISISEDSKNVAKVEVDLNTHDYNFNIFSQNQPRGIVLEIRPPKKDIITAILNVEAAEARENPLSLDSWQRISGEGEGIFTVVIDPGHGGKDPGAVGPSGVMEKDITLQIARKLSKILKQNLKVEVYLTRNGDEFIPLDRRTEMANQIGGDLFVSIHTNAAWDYRARGVETFYNSRYAYGEGAEEVALRENAAFGAEVPSSVKNIIWDLIQNQYRQESEELARLVQSKIIQTCGVKNRGVKSAPFYVLRGASMPAILIEVGFISNPWQERKLKDSQYQELVALGIYKGIAAYIKSFTRKVRTIQ